MWIINTVCAVSLGLLGRYLDERLVTQDHFMAGYFTCWFVMEYVRRSDT